MITSYIFDKVDELTEKFKRFLVHRKKMKALKNFSESSNFEHKPYLPLIEKCMDDGFLGDKEADFIDYLLERYELRFLDWAHKTKWLKGEMRRLAIRSSKSKIAPSIDAPLPKQLFLFDMDAIRTQSPNVPTHILNKPTIKQNRRTV